MAIKGFTQADKSNTKAKTSTPSKAKGKDLTGSGRPTVTSSNRSNSTTSYAVPRSPGLGSGGNPNVYGVPTQQVSNRSAVPSPGFGTGGDVMGDGVMSTRATNAGQSTAMGGAGANFGYTPQGLGMLYDNPGLLAGDVLGRLGIDNFGMNQMLGDSLWPALYAYTMLNPNLAQAQDQDVIDYIANYMTQMTTPGGSVPSYEQLMTALMGVGSQDSDLGRQFAMLTPQEQTEFLKQYAQAAAYGLNPLAQRMLGNSMDFQAQNYLGGVAKGNPDGSSYADYFRRNGLTGFR